MKDNIAGQAGDGHEVVHHKPRHMAERMEGWVGKGFVVIGALLLAGLIYAFMHTGADVPSYMR